MISEHLSTILAETLGGEITDLHRLSGGASRTTWSFEFQAEAGNRQRLILQQARPSPLGATRPRLTGEARLLSAARRAGVPVAPVIASGEDDPLGSEWIVVEQIEGESIPRKILRDPEYQTARALLVAQCGGAVGRIHSIPPREVPDLVFGDQLHDFVTLLESLGQPRPVLEMAARRLELTRPPSHRRVVVHGDFRMGNLLVGPAGLGAVLDWELAHLGDPLEDLGWFCVRAWRFGSPKRAGGVGSREELLEAYSATTGADVDPDAVTWWEALGTFKWGVMCLLQAATHLSGAARSPELATIGRRVTENEWDLLSLLGVERPSSHVINGAPDARAPHREEDTGRGSSTPFGRPTATELIQAVREFLSDEIVDGTEGSTRFQARVASNALAIVERELTMGPEIAADHAKRLASLGHDNDDELVRAIRSGAFDDGWEELGRILALSVRDQLLVCSPSYLDAA